MWPGRIAFAVVVLWSAFCLALAAVVFVNLRRIESPERYIAFGLGAIMLYMGGSMLAGLIWPPKPKDPNAPIEIPPLDQVRGRTAYRDDSALARNVMLVIGAVFFAASLGAAAAQPILLVFTAVAAGILAGAGVKIRRQIRYGRARLELDAPARRGDTMCGIIAMSGSAWGSASGDVDATVEILAIRSAVVARSSASTSTARNGNDLTIRFTAAIPLIDTSEGRVSWNIQLETRSPNHRATFLIDVA
ncbi:MAG TPA: hypothetical protein VI670_26240 [Thermoanaerobaculia bacterium]|jgi:hypothetical protein